MITREQLSTEQEAALQHMLTFIKSTERQMLLAGYAGTGKCLDGNNIIWTDTGLKRLRSLSNSSHSDDTSISCDVNVLSFNDSTKSLGCSRATNVWRDSKKYGVNFTLNKGYSHRVSTWHPIYCSLDGNISYHTASDIMSALNANKEVWIPVVQGHPNLSVDKFITLTTPRFTIKLTSGIAYILGALVGDGSLTTTTLNQCRFSNIDTDIIDTLVHYAELDGIEFDIQRVSNSSCDWSIRSPVIADLIRYFKLNVTSDQKFIPDSIIESPKSVIASFICGLFDTDGSSDKRDGYLEYCTSSTRLSEDVHSILLAFGILARRKFRPNKKAGAYHIYIRGIHAQVFYNDIGFMCSRKQIHVNKLVSGFNQNDRLYPPTIAPLMEHAFKTRFERIDSDDSALNRVGSYYKKYGKLSNYYVDYYMGRRTPSRDKLTEFIQDTNSYKLSDLTFYHSDNKIWLKVESYEVCPIDLYDLVVPDTHSFIANGIINHNTALVNVFLDHVKRKSHYTCTCTAPTNEAVRVLAKSTGEKYDKTIYSLLGLALVHEDDTAPKIKPIGKSKLEEYDIVVIDEASMIDSNLFDIIQQQLNAHSYIKVIYVGDSAQLPPIIDVQELGRKQSRVFDLQNQVTLREVQRVTKGNPIIGVVTPIRDNLESPEDKFSRETILNEDRGVEFIDSRDTFMEMMFDDFVSDAYKNDSNYVRAIAYTNKAIDALNIHIRRKLFDSTKLDEYVVGENVIVDSPIVEKITSKVSKIIYTVGERLRVLAVNMFTDAEYGYRVWELRVVNYEETPDEQITKTVRVIHKDDMDRYHSALTELAQEAKEKSLKVMNGRDGKPRPIYTKYEAWKDYFAFKEQYAWIKYSYALTTHKCVHPDTIVNSSDTSIRMKDIPMGSMIENSTRTAVDVNYKSISSHDAHVRVILQTGQVILCGINHPICIFDGRMYEYKSADQLTQADYVCISYNKGNPIGELSTVSIIPSNDNGRDDLSIAFSELTPDLAWAMGALLGDGCYSYKSNRVDYTAPDDIDLLDRMYNMLISHGFNAKYIIRNGRKFSVRVESINFRNILIQFGFNRHTAGSKYLYDPIIQLPNSWLKYILQGLFDSDGNISVVRNKIRYTSASHRLIMDIQTILLRFGVVSYVYSQNPKHHTLNISGKYVKTFCDVIGFTSIRNRTKQSKLSYSSKTDNDIIPYGDYLVKRFVTAYHDKYPNTRGHAGKGLHSPSMKPIGKLCNSILRDKLRLSVNFFGTLYKIVVDEQLNLPEFHDVYRRGYFYSPVKSIELIHGVIELMDIEVSDDHTYIANGIVTHNSQGSTVERVYVVERDLNRLSWNDEERNKLKYVAFTRASHLLRILQ